MERINITLTQGKTKISIDLEADQVKELHKIASDNSRLSSVKSMLQFFVDTLPKQAAD